MSDINSNRLLLVNKCIVIIILDVRKGFKIINIFRLLKLKYKT